MNNKRALLIIFFVLLVFIALVVKLVNIQIIHNEEYSYYAQKQQTSTEKIKANHGLIYDRNSDLLVYNRSDISFYADGRMMTDAARNEIAELFSKKFKKTKKHYLNLMKDSKKTVCIEKKVSAEIASSLQNIKVKGLFFREEPTRVYHYGNLASHVLGFLNTDNEAVMGISKYYEDAINGEDGSRLIFKNAVGDVVTIDEKEVNPAVAGDNIYLTINKSYQLILEDELRKGVKDYGAASATGIMMNPNTGEVLALANIDDFNPNKFWEYDDYQRRNRAITDTYEPGSTFKSFTIASLLDQKLCSLNEKINLENGSYKYQDVNIKDTHPFSSLSVREIIEQSSNIGVSKLVQRIDAEKYFKYLRGFGFGNTTSITLPGETPGKLRKPTEWSKVSKVYLSFGYEISVTPIQMTAAYCALINGGVLFEPQLVYKQVNSKGVAVNEFSPKEIRRVIAPETSITIRNILKGVVKNGTGQKAFSELISIGGKTGTSQKLVDGKYSKNKYNSSFVGFFPAENPQVVCLILINSPEQGLYGGLVAAPVFKNVAERIVLNDVDKYKDDANTGLVKDIKSAEVNDKNKKRSDAGNKVEEIKKTKSISNSIMPNVINMNIKDAIYALTKLGVKYKVKGSGIIKSQSIAAGKQIESYETCVLECSEVSIKGASLY